jgi:hypothetical protein
MQQMGLQARLMSQALRKMSGNASKAGCTLIFLNQIRYKVLIIEDCMHLIMNTIYCLITSSMIYATVKSLVSVYMVCISLYFCRLVSIMEIQK